MNQLPLNLILGKKELGKVLDPQPGKFLDCVENYKVPGQFNFFTGNEMEGHDLVLTVNAPDLDLEPIFDFDSQLWFWGNVTEDTKEHREYWRKSP